MPKKNLTDTIYVATRWERKNDVRHIYELAERYGLEPSHDWTVYDDQLTDERPIRAAEDVSGVMEASLFLLLSDEGGTGMYVELGVALVSNMLLGHPAIYIVGKWNDRSIFFRHPSVKQVGFPNGALWDWKNGGAS